MSFPSRWLISCCKQVERSPSHSISFLSPFSSIYDTVQTSGLSISINVLGIDKHPYSYIDISLQNFFISGLIKHNGFFSFSFFETSKTITLLRIPT